MPKPWGSLHLFIAIALLSATGIEGPYTAAQEIPAEKNTYEQWYDRGAIWDDRFTNGVSGLGWGLPDPGSSEGKSGVKKYHPDYDYQDDHQLGLSFDQVEQHDVAGIWKIKRIRKRATLRVPFPIEVSVYQQHPFTLKPGYYQLSLADATARVSEHHQHNLTHAETTLPDEDTAKRFQKNERDAQDVLILHHQGHVVGIWPVANISDYNREKRQKKSKRPFAILFPSAQGPQLNLYSHGDIYTAWLRPAPSISPYAQSVPLSQALQQQTLYQQQPSSTIQCPTSV